LQREKVIEVAKEIEVENTCEGLVKYDGAKGDWFWEYIL
jgi:hypothetical protein